MKAWANLLLFKNPNMDLRESNLRRQPREEGLLWAGLLKNVTLTYDWRGRESKKEEQTGTVDELVWWEGHESCLSITVAAGFSKAVTLWMHPYLL